MSVQKHWILGKMIPSPSIIGFWCLMPLISVISWQSVLLVEETRVRGENHWPAASHWQTLSLNVVSSTPHLRAGFIHFFVEQNQGLFKDFPGQKLQFSSTFFWAFSYIKPCLTLEINFYNHKQNIACSFKSYKQNSVLFNI